MMKIIKNLMVWLGLVLGTAAIFTLLFSAANLKAFHGGPTQHVEGLHAEGDTIADGTQRPVLMGGDDGTNLRNILVDATGRTVVSVTASSGTGSMDIDDAVGSTQTGSLMLGKHKDDLVALTTADGDADAITLDSLGQIHVNPEAHHVFDTMDAVGSWLILDDAAENLTTTKKHVLGDNALIFDKTDGSNHTEGVIDLVVSAVNLGDVSPHDIIQLVSYIPDLQDVAYVLVRVGTNDSNYNEWRIPDTSLTAAEFETLTFTIGDASHAGITGNGWDPVAITYVAVGVSFDGEDDGLVGIIFDEFSYHTNQHTSTSLTSEVSSSVSSANINVQKIGGSATDKNSGSKSNGSQRIVIATDDINLSAIKTAVETLDNAVSGSSFSTIEVAGLLQSNSPTTEAAIVKLFNAGDITATQMGASTAITIAGTGTLTKVCVILTTGNISTAEDGDLIFFTTDPTISENTADLTVVKAKQISSIISLTGTDFTTNFATAQVNCQSVDEPYTALTHVLWHAKGANAYTDEVIDLLVTFRRDS